MDVDRLKALIDLVANHSIATLEIVEGDTRVKIKSDLRPDEPRRQTISASTEESPKLKRDVPPLVSCPMSGTFYAAPSPSEPPFCKIGDRVEPDTTLCIIEAMKTLTPVPSGLSGQIQTIFVENGSLVEFGQPLFEIA